jgi:hypothetical protein
MYKNWVGELLTLENLRTLEKAIGQGPATADKATPVREFDRQLLILGSSGLLGSEPPPSTERAYDDAKAARAEARRWDAKVDGAVAMIWPATPVGWLALVGSYLLGLVIAVVVLALVAPGWAPSGIVRLVNPGALKSPPPEGQMAGRFGSINVRVKSVHVGRTTGGVALPQPCLVIVIEITNPAGSRAIDYKTWRGAGGANVIDDRGKSWLQVAAPAGVAAAAATIPPGGTADDTLLFVPPVAGYASLELFLPGASVGSEETVRLRLPANEVKLIGE